MHSRVTPRSRGALLSWLALLATACGSVPKSPPVLNLDTFLSDLVSAACDSFVRCGLYSDEAICAATLTETDGAKTFNSFGTDIALAKAGVLQFSAGVATECFATVKALSCADVLTASAAGPLASCGGAFSGGTVEGGGVCLSDAQCVPGFDCLQQSPAVCSGICTELSPSNCNPDTLAPCTTSQACLASTSSTGQPVYSCFDFSPPGGVNEDCGGPFGSECQAGLTCAGTAGGNTCVVPLAAGSSCTSSAACEAGLGCTGTPATCQALPGAGQSCTTNVGCAHGLNCVYSDDGASSSCLPPAGPGDPCTALWQCAAPYFPAYSDLICDEAKTHKCITAPSDGPCSDPLQTGFGTCNPANSWCEVMSGDDGLCVAYLPPGDDCASAGSPTQPECGLTATCVATATGSADGTCTPTLPSCAL
jgi:hypothetical protein